MKRPPKKYVCEKCGYLGDTSEHEGCDYLAWTTGEQLYIDQLERELALLKASPASAPEGFALVPVVPTHAILDVMFNAGIDRHDGDLTLLYRAMLAAAPTPPVSECVDPVMTKEELIAAAESIGMRFPGASIPPVSEDRKDAGRFREGWTHACNALCMEIALWIERCPHCGMPAPKAPAMQEDKP